MSEALCIERIVKQKILLWLVSYTVSLGDTNVTHFPFLFDWSP